MLAVGRQGGGEAHRQGRPHRDAPWHQHCPSWAVMRAVKAASGRLRLGLGGLERCTAARADAASVATPSFCQRGPALDPSSTLSHLLPGQALLFSAHPPKAGLSGHLSWLRDCCVWAGLLDRRTVDSSRGQDAACQDAFRNPRAAPHPSDHHPPLLPPLPTCSVRGPRAKARRLPARHPGHALQPGHAR